MATKKKEITVRTHHRRRVVVGKPKHTVRSKQKLVATKLRSIPSVEDSLEAESVKLAKSLHIQELVLLVRGNRSNEHNDDDSK